MDGKGPDFLCIGAQASGTSWLYQQLKKRLDFQFPNRKEIHYFDRKHPGKKPSGLIHRTRDIFRSSDSPADGCKLFFSMLVRRFRKSLYGDPRDFKKDGRRKKQKETPESDSGYLSIFATEKITGDVTPAYATLSDAEVEQMAKLMPNSRIVFLIRNPVERNWSAYRKKLKKSNFSKFTSLEMKYFFNQPGVVKRTNYIDTIDRYSRYFGADNLLIGFYDAIIDQPNKLLADIILFVGGDPEAGTRRKRAKKVVNESPKEEIPQEILLFLREKYRPLIEALAERYGSYASRWLDEINGTENPGLELRATVER